MNKKQTFTTIKSFVDNFLEDLDDRQREVVKARYGLGGANPVTLQVVGDRYGITRERVRQIEAGALDALRQKVQHPYVASFVKAATVQLGRVGGVQRDADFLDALFRATKDKGTSGAFNNPARFLLALSNEVSRYRDNYGTWHTYWYLSSGDRKRAEKFIARLVADLRRNKDDVISSKRFNEVLKNNMKLASISEAAAQSYIGASKHFTQSPFGDFGLNEWAEINPRTARDWAYLILKREKKPMHFTKLAEHIAKHRTGKNTNTQTVHNELIKDKRFVLVGRGMYGLQEFGLIPGTAKDIIRHVLKENGPLTSRQVVKMVRDQRILKEGTILINLQNKKHFRATEDGKYRIREA